MSASDHAKPRDPWLVVLAAQGIQTYTLRSDKLRGIVGTSELVESMTNELREASAAHVPAR